MTTRRRWGKAGVRLTPQQADARDFRAVAERSRLRKQRAYSDGLAKTKWAAGLLVPYFITIALDAHSLDGPEVDIACGATEPDVDMWEAGVLYPTWEQLCALAELTQKQPIFFTDPPERLDYRQTSLRFHYLELADEPPSVPVWKFTDDAIAVMKATVRS